MLNIVSGVTSYIYAGSVDTEIEYVYAGDENVFTGIKDVDMGIEYLYAQKEYVYTGIKDVDTVIEYVYTGNEYVYLGTNDVHTGIEYVYIGIECEDAGTECIDAGMTDSTSKQRLSNVGNQCYVDVSLFLVFPSSEFHYKFHM